MMQLQPNLFGGLLKAVGIGGAAPPRFDTVPPLIPRNPGQTPGIGDDIERRRKGQL